MYRTKIKQDKNKYYTEDDIIIYTIYIENITESQANVESLFKLFSKFGNVKTITIEKLYETDNGDMKGSGTVQFDSSESAYRAILLGEINEIVISYADSWKQPVQNHKVQLTPEFCKNFVLDNLNDDCLLYLYSFIQFQDQLKLIQISNRQKKLFQNYYHLKKTFNTSNLDFKQLTLHQIRNFFIDYGTNIEHLDLLSQHYDEKCSRLLPLALKYCSNLRSIKVREIPFNNKKYSEQISKLYPKLKNIQLNGCAISNDDLQHFSKLSELEVLNLSGTNNTFDGKYFEKFHNIKELEIANNYEFSDETFIRTCKSFRSLKVLNIIDIKSLHNLECFYAIKYCNNLEVLKMSLFRNDMTDIGKSLGGLLKLKKLYVRNSNPRSCSEYLIETPNLNDFIKEISNTSLTQSLKSLKFIYCIIDNIIILEFKKFKELKELGICLKSNKISQRFWTAITSLIKTLRKLNIRIGSYRTSYEQFCLKFIEILKNKNCKHLFKLNCDMSRNEYDTIVKSPEYLSNRKIIEITPFYFTKSESFHAKVGEEFKSFNLLQQYQ